MPERFTRLLRHPFPVSAAALPRLRRCRRCSPSLSPPPSNILSSTKSPSGPPDTLRPHLLLCRLYTSPFSSSEPAPPHPPPPPLPSSPPPHSARLRVLPPSHAAASVATPLPYPPNQKQAPATAHPPILPSAFLRCIVLHDPSTPPELLPGLSRIDPKSVPHRRSPSPPPAAALPPATALPLATATCISFPPTPPHPTHPLDHSPLCWLMQRTAISTSVCLDRRQKIQNPAGRPPRCSPPLASPFPTPHTGSGPLPKLSPSPFGALTSATSVENR